MCPEHTLATIGADVFDAATYRLYGGVRSIHRGEMSRKRSIPPDLRGIEYRIRTCVSPGKVQWADMRPRSLICVNLGKWGGWYGAGRKEQVRLHEPSLGCTGSSLLGGRPTCSPLRTDSTPRSSGFRSLPLRRWRCSLLARPTRSCRCRFPPSSTSPAPSRRPLSIPLAPLT